LPVPGATPMLPVMARYEAQTRTPGSRSSAGHGAGHPRLRPLALILLELAAVCALVLLTPPRPAYAATQNMDIPFFAGCPQGSNWSAAGCWNSGSGPVPAGGDTANVGAGGGCSNPNLTNYDLGAGAPLAAVILTCANGSMTISGGPISLQSGGSITDTFSNGGNDLLPGVTLNGTSTFSLTAAHEGLLFNGAITGDGPLTLSNTGLADGLQLLSTGSTWTGGTTIAGTSEVVAVGNGAIPTTSAVTVNSGAALLFTLSSTIGSLAGAGTVTMQHSGTLLTVGGDNTSTTFSGVYQASGGGSAALTKTGSGTLTLNGTSTFGGATTVSGGTLTVNGALTNSAVTVASGATLNGTGTIPSLTAQPGSTVSPGPAGGTGTLSVNGAAGFAAGSTFAVTLNGSGAGSTLTAGSGTNLGDANLSVTISGSTPAAGTVYTIVNTSTGFLGTFHGLANAKTFTAGGTTFRINYNPLTVTLTVLASTGTNLSSSPNPSTVGQSVTFTAAVTCNGGSTTATGFVIFTIDGVPGLPLAVIGTPRKATFSTSTLTVGGHPATAVYNGDSNCAASTSNGITQTVNAAGAGTTLTSSLNPSAPGQPVTFTATVACTGFTPTGTVTFTIDVVPGSPVTLVNGTATFTTSSLSPGSHTVSAAYSGDSNCMGATSNGVTQTVNQSGLTLTSSPNPSPPGQPVTLTATVTCPNGAPSGTVTFFDNGSPIASLPLNSKAVPPIAAFTTSTLAPGSHSITTTYSDGGGCPAATSNTLTQVVGAAVYTVLLTSSQSPSTPGQPVTFTAAPSCPGFTPTGIVTFTIDGVMGSPAKLIGGVASLTTSSLTPGSHSVSAAYSGDGNCGPATSAVLMQMVTLPGTSALPPGDLKNCQALPAAEQLACFGQAIGNLGTSNLTPLPAPLPGSYCTMPDKSRGWVPQGSTAPNGCS
jgi:large repetitive protein